MPPPPPSPASAGSAPDFPAFGVELGRPPFARPALSVAASGSPASAFWPPTPAGLFASGTRHAPRRHSNSLSQSESRRHVGPPQPCSAPAAMSAETQAGTRQRLEADIDPQRDETPQKH